MRVQMDDTTLIWKDLRGKDAKTYKFTDATLPHSLTRFGDHIVERGFIQLWRICPPHGHRGGVSSEQGGRRRMKIE